MIEEAHIDDSQALTDLTFRSKAYWGYSANQMEIWREDLQVSPAYIEQNHVFRLTDSGDLIGYYSYFAIEGVKVKLDNLFVDPAYIGKGYGKQLFLDFVARMRHVNVDHITLDADPHAELFYKQFGFEVIGQKPSTVPGRFLPIMHLELNNLIIR